MSNGNGVQELQQTVSELTQALNKAHRTLEHMKAIRKLKRDCKKANIDARVLTWLVEELEDEAANDVG